MSALVQRTTSGSVLGHTCSLVYMGPELGLKYLEPYLSDRVFRGGPVQATEPVCVEPGTADSAVEGADLIVRVLEASSPEGAGTPVRPGVTLPLRINLVAHLQGEDELHATPSPRERKRQRRRVERYAYTGEVSREERDFHVFYDTMHQPTMAARHGSRARSLARGAAMDDLFAQGFLYFLRSHGERVAGVLCQVQGDVCHARLVGWLGADPVHLEREALKSANLLLLDWARAEGFRAVDFQGCEPFLAKGTFQSKRHLGTVASPSGGAFSGVLVRLEVGRDTPAVRHALADNPPICIDEAGQLSSVYFHDAATPPRTELSGECRGIESTRFVDLDALLA